MKRSKAGIIFAIFCFVSLFVYSFSYKHNLMNIDYADKNIILSFNDGKLKLSIPRDSYMASDDDMINSISLKTLDISSYADESLSYIVSDSLYDLKFKPATLDQPIRLTIQYGETLIPEDIPEQSLVVVYRNGSDWSVLPTQIDEENNEINVKISQSIILGLSYVKMASKYRGRVIDRNWWNYIPTSKDIIVHDYAPSIVKYNGKWHIWWCSLNGPGFWDSIWYATSDDGLKWSCGKEVLRSTPGTLDEVAVCDPSVVYTGKKWYMYYTGIRGPKGSVDWRNRIFVATADSPKGPWTKHPNPIIDANSGCDDSDQRKYCVGQSTVVYKNGTFYHWYTDTGKSSNGVVKQTMLSISSDGINFKIMNDNKPVFNMSNASVKYDKRTGKFFMIYGEVRDNELFWNVSSDGIHWAEHNPARIIDVYSDGCNHNPGIAGDAQGHINGATFVIYGQGSCAGVGDQWGQWQMDRTEVEFLESTKNDRLPELCRDCPPSGDCRDVCKKYSVYGVYPSAMFCSEENVDSNKPCYNCIQDPCISCGDGICSSGFENKSNCSKDCDKPSNR